jgi:predicted transcriptional regulator
MDDKRTLGEQERDLLRFLAESVPVTARDAAEAWGEERGLARSTVATMLERLRAKGFLSRTKRQGTFQYAPTTPRGELLQGLVREFVEKTLGGSLSPFVAYLAERGRLSEDEKIVLEQAIRQAEAPEKKP